MKNICILFVLAMTLWSCEEEKPMVPPGEYRIEVAAPGIYNGIRGHIGTLDNRRRVSFIDTAMVVNEAMVFTGKVDHTSLKLLTINGVNGNLEFVLEPGYTKITVTKDSIARSVIEESAANMAYQSYKKEMENRALALRDIRREINKANQSGDRAAVNAINEKVNEATKARDHYFAEFVTQNPDSDLSLLILESALNNRALDLSIVKNSASQLNSVMARNTFNQNIGARIQNYILEQEAVEKVKIGKVAPDFSAPTPDGNTLALSDIKGKATIVDFWASWCGPCRRENPNVVRVYNKYKDKGLEIISVSLDKPNQKQRWVDAIAKDKMDWHHVGNLKYWSDPIAKLYGVKAIPATFILDEEGKIVAKKLRGPALERQISSMLD